MLWFVMTNFTVKIKRVAALSSKIKPLPFYQNCGLPCKVHFNNLPGNPQFIFHSFSSRQEFFTEHTLLSIKVIIIWINFCTSKNVWASVMLLSSTPCADILFCNYTWEHSRYAYSNDWIGPTHGLDKALTICDLGLLLLISESVQNKFWAELTPSQTIRKNLINCLLVNAQLTLHKF